MKALSKIASGIIGQPMFGLLSKSRQMEREGRKIIHFEIGDPNFDSPPCAIETAKKALDANLTHYTDSRGVIEFREAVAEYTRAGLGFKPSLEQILICPANAVIDFLARCVVDPGQGIIYPDPGFPTYYSVINYNGFLPIGVRLKEENCFRMDPEDVRGKITDKTRLIIINTPQNPTGSVMSEKEVLEIAGIAEEHNIYLLSDEVYDKIIYDKRHYSPSTVDRCRERTIVLNSLSKVYAMSGWRLGYAIGPEKVIEKMGLLLETIISCLPAFTQLAGRAVLLVGDKGFLTERVEALKRRRDILVEGLNGLAGISCVTPEGSYYLFPNIKDTGMTSEEYSERLLQETGVCVLPGRCFGEFGEGYIRLCYASTPVEAIEEALDKMAEFHTKHFSNLKVEKLHSVK